MRENVREKEPWGLNFCADSSRAPNTHPHEKRKNSACPLWREKTRKSAYLSRGYPFLEIGTDDRSTTTRETKRKQKKNRKKKEQNESRVINEK